MIKINCILSKRQKLLKLLRLCYIVLIFFGTANLCFAQSSGEKLFKENNPKDAVQVLENEILNGQISANTYNFLGLGYYQIGEYEKSVDAFGRGIAEITELTLQLHIVDANTRELIMETERMNIRFD